MFKAISNTILSIAALGVVTILVLGVRPQGTHSQLAAAATANPYYNINPATIFPTPTSVLPQGGSYTDTVPDTLDLAERARWFISGAAQEQVPYQNIWIPGAPAIFNAAAPGASECTSIPCIGKTGGYQNWGKLAFGMFLAREMNGYDRNDANGTVTNEYRSLTTMLSWDTWPILQMIGGGGYALVWGQRYMTPASIVMHSLTARYRQDPTNQSLKTAINEYVRMHKDLLVPQVISGSTYYNFLDPSTDTIPDAQLESSTGYNGKYWSFAFVNGRAALALFDWYNLSGNQDSFDVGSKLTAYLRNNPTLWLNPDPMRFGNAGPGQFEGHIHAYLQIAHAFLAEAEARIKTNPNDPIVQQNIQLSKNMYEFVKMRTQGSVLGNFGEMDNLDDMIRLGIKLTDLGVYPYFDEVERWTRNQLADGQIDPATVANYIPNISTSVYSTNQVGNKVAGLWFSDATHSLSIPPAAQMFNLDDATNPMRALYTVWDHITQIKGSYAQINFPLNRASQYIEVKSDLPYQGRVEIDLKASLGPVTAMGVRIPSWVDKTKVTVTRRDASGVTQTLSPNTDWIWVSNSYVQPTATLQPNTVYIISFPIKVYQMQFSDIRSQNQFWYESDYGSPNIGYPETVVSFTGTFRGDTLVDATPRPSGGIPRYQRQNLAALPPTDVAPLTITVQRFIMGVSNPLPPPTPPAPLTPTVTLTAVPANIQVGQTSIIHAMFAPSTGDSITNTTINIGTNSLVPYASTTDRTYTYTATAAGDVLFQAYAQTTKFPIWTTYKSVTLHVVPAPAPTSCSLGGITVQSGQSAAFYSAPSVVIPAVCASMAQNRTCTNGILSGNSSYQYGSCIQTQPARPTVTITADSTSIAVGQSTTIRANFTAATGDTITNTTINIGTTSLVPYSSAVLRTYTFTPTAPGDTTFQAYAQTATYPVWTTNASITVHVSP